MSNAAKMPNPQESLLPNKCTAYGGEPLVNGKFLPIYLLLDVLQGKCGLPILSSIPDGKKENVYFLVENTEHDKRSCARLPDDCHFVKAHGSCPRSTFLCEKDKLRSVVSKPSGYYIMQRRHYKQVLVIMKPQPSEEQLIHIQRSYKRHALDETYQRRITWIISQEGTIPVPMVACVEYIGISPVHTSISEGECTSDIQVNQSLQVPSMLNAEKMLSNMEAQGNQSMHESSWSDAEKILSTMETSLPNECMANGGKPLPDGKFLPIHKLLDALHGKYDLPILSAIPTGKKENIFFLVVNTKHYGQSYSQFLDDCGPWGNRVSSPKTSYLCGKDVFKTVIQRKSGYYLMKNRRPRKYLALMDPQPSEEQLIHIKRSYRKHSLDENYQRRVTWFICQEKNSKMPMVACVEYIGISPKLPYPTSRKRGKCISDIKSNLSLPEPSVSNAAKMPSSLETSLPHEYIPNGGEPLPNGKFLPVHKVLDALQGKCGLPILSSIPPGKKENVFFLVNNTKYSRQSYNLLWDDDYAWKEPGDNFKFSYIFTTDHYRNVIHKSSGYHVAKRKNYKLALVLLDPQPPEEQVIHIQRCYRRHILDEKYQRRVTWLICQDETSTMPLVACVEYIGKCTEESMGQTPDVQTQPDVKELMNQALQVQPPHEAVSSSEDEEMQDSTDFCEYSDAQLPAKMSMRNVDEVSSFANDLQKLVSLVQNGHPFIQKVTFTNGKMPMVILYIEHQIDDILRFCCQESEGTVFGFNTVISLGEVHVTFGTFKHLAVTRKTTGMNPVFPGPIFLHGDSDFATYFHFFCHLANVLHESPVSPVIGSSDEPAMVRAIEKAFPQGRRISCQHHLKINLLDHLKDGLGLCRSDCQTISNSIFGNNGIVHAETLGSFNLRVQVTQDILEETASGSAQQYFDDRLLPQLRQNFQTAQDKPFCPSAWTNNNSESLDHILKQLISWTSRPLLSLIQNLQDVVDYEYCQLKLSLVHSGDFELCPNFSKFGRSMEVWNSLTRAQQQFHFKQFLETCVSEEYNVLLCEGMPTVGTSSGGKKSGQGKRKRSASSKRIIIPMKDE